MSIEWIVMGGVLLLCIGAAFGQWAEARLWRAKAANNPRYRKESGGKLYYVIPAEEYDEFHSKAVAAINACQKAAYRRMPVGYG
jgi:hypothetical protein